MSRTARLRIGTSGWVYDDWRGVFYPETLPTRQWFAFYSRYFDTVEVNNTFYRLPAAETFTEWGRQAPPGFVYAIKASRFLTHVKRLSDPLEPLENLLGRARRLGRHLGPVLYQLPPHWGVNTGRLAAFFELLPKGVRHVVELRDASWCCPEVERLLTAAKVSFCIHDLPGFACPTWVTGPIVYFRFHGPGAMRYAGRYSPAQLRRWVPSMQEFLRSGRDVYAYFNNDLCGHAIRNAQELRELLGAPATTG